MGLLVAWKESLSLLKPKNFKLLMMVSYNAVTKASEALFQSGSSPERRAMIGCLFGFLFSLYWYEIVPNLIAPSLVFCMEMVSQHCRGMDTVARYIALFYAVFYVWCFLIHPSVGRKNIGDFFSVKNLLIYLVSSVLFYSMVMPFVCYVGSGMFFPTPGYASASSGLDNLLGLFVFVFVLNISLLWPALTVFFSLDSDRTVKSLFLSIVRSAKMIIYNFPGFIILMSGMIVAGLACVALGGGVFGGLARMLASVLPLDSMSLVALNDVIVKGVLFGIAFGSVMPFLVSVISNVYIKQLYDHKDRYI